VSVSDLRTGAYFELDAEPEKPMDVFHHPYAYAAFHGVAPRPQTRRLSPAAR